ncbi:hypothetical protein JRQ81_010606 [Phrynocephalus forsythii]|uniref:Endonuclease/exonuclease/phosphatase domain-containing protein n=1 Tax=Phrynocephalus forsythii TaxID=171643 RepID=A0A9Q0Y197_9SAUR|nr:hypothetical protein JRQ81_010606 [Phrynocephalus forsythii]
MLQETWALDAIELNGYTAHQLFASPSAKKGRPKGGIITLVSTKLHMSLTTLPSYEQFAIAVLVKFSCCAILFVNVYIPPQRLYKQIDLVWQGFGAYIEDLLISCSCPKVFIGGDFNAKLGANDAALFAAFLLSPPVSPFSSIINVRCSKDKTCNYAGLKLAQMVYQLNLHILNGNTTGDMPGEFTFWSGSKMSTLDYIIVSHDIADPIIKFEVDTRIDSDHLPLCVQLRVPGQDTQIEEVLQFNFEVTANYNRIKWTTNIAERFSELLQTDIYSEIHSSFLAMTANCEIIGQYGRLIKTLTDVLTVKGQNKPHSSKWNSKKWFDWECRDAKKILISKFKLQKENPTAVKADDLMHLKSQYKQLIKAKKIQEQQHLWEQLIHAVRTKDMSNFWRLTSPALNNNVARANCLISSNIWESFFQEIYSNKAKPNHSDSALSYSVFIASRGYVKQCE